LRSGDGKTLQTSTKLIRSRENAIYKHLVRLASSARARREHRAALLDGLHLIESFRASGGTVDTLVINESSYERAPMRRLFDETPANARVTLADRLFEDIAQVMTPTGVLAVIRTPDPARVPEQLATCVLLEGIQDPGNLGSILRTAVAAGVTHVLLAKGCVFAWSPKVLRAGQGAHFFLSIHEEVALAAVIARFDGDVVVTDPHAAASLFDAQLGERVAWIFGAEGAGVSPDLAARATLRVRIPMPGPAESLNVAAAVAVCLFEQVRRMTRVNAPAA
jgi:RNA methyltransferase, TrmH family